MLGHGTSSMLDNPPNKHVRYMHTMHTMENYFKLFHGYQEIELIFMNVCIKCQLCIIIGAWEVIIYLCLSSGHTYELNGHLIMDVDIHKQLGLQYSHMHSVLISRHTIGNYCNIPDVYHHNTSNYCTSPDPYCNICYPNSSSAFGSDQMIHSYNPWMKNIRPWHR
jgi:hypothetical protein